MKDSRKIYSQEMELQAKKDYESAKILLEESNDFGNILFLFEQSYEKILKSVYVYCECVVFGKKFNEVMKRDQKYIHRHESAAKLIQKILPNSLENYKETTEILDEKLAKGITENKFSVKNKNSLNELMTILPKYEELVKQQKNLQEFGEKKTNWDKNEYQLWKDFLDQLKMDDFRIGEKFKEFNDAYEPFESNIEKNLNNSAGIKEIIKNGALFMLFAFELAPISLAPKYARYPVVVANFENLGLFFKGNNSNFKKGLQTIGNMIEFLIENKDNLGSLILKYEKFNKKLQD